MCIEVHSETGPSLAVQSLAVPSPLCILATVVRSSAYLGLGGGGIRALWCASELRVYGVP